MIRATTVVAVKIKDHIAMAGDGQVTIGEVIMKRTARKIRTLYHDQVLAGFAGAVADALTLFEKFEGHLDKHSGNLRKAAVELAKEWRTDRYLRRLEAWLIVANAEHLLVLSGDGEVIEPDDNVVAIGSGGPYAQAAAKALLTHSDLTAPEIARRAMEIAASLCIYTNDNITVLELQPNRVAVGEESRSSDA
ncbi:MAG: ATP-dependent protease subunit HslV [Chloroflexi bacterium]|nr:ATP-dependent protease subunit HslV [Chloroflexota bacterium]